MQPVSDFKTALLTRPVLRRVAVPAVRLLQHLRPGTFPPADRPAAAEMHVALILLYGEALVTHSANAVVTRAMLLQIFHAVGVPADQFTCVNILEDESMRAGLKEYSMVRLTTPFVTAGIYPPGTPTVAALCG